MTCAAVGPRMCTTSHLAARTMSACFGRIRLSFCWPKSELSAAQSGRGLRACCSAPPFFDLLTILYKSWPLAGAQNRVAPRTSSQVRPDPGHPHVLGHEMPTLQAMARKYTEPVGAFLLQCTATESADGLGCAHMGGLPPGRRKGRRGAGILREFAREIARLCRGPSRGDVARQRRGPSAGELAGSPGNLRDTAGRPNPQASRLAHGRCPSRQRPTAPCCVGRHIAVAAEASRHIPRVRARSPLRASRRYFGSLVVLRSRAARAASPFRLRRSSPRPRGRPRLLLRLRRRSWLRDRYAEEAGGASAADVRSEVDLGGPGKRSRCKAPEAPCLVTLREP